MTLFYCLKYKSKTNTKSEEIEVTANGHNRLIGICSNCNTKKGIFVGDNGKFHKKTASEITLEKEKRKETILNRKVKKIGREIIDAGALKYVRKCLAELD